MTTLPKTIYALRPTCALKKASQKFSVDRNIALHQAFNLHEIYPRPCITIFCALLEPLSRKFSKQIFGVFVKENPPPVGKVVGTIQLLFTISHSDKNSLYTIIELCESFLRSKFRKVHIRNPNFWRQKMLP